jgi:hypothetical protein
MKYDCIVYVWINDTVGFTPYWFGNTLDKAIKLMKVAQEKGYKGIKLEWRPFHWK